MTRILTKTELLLAGALAALLNTACSSETADTTAAQQAIATTAAEAHTASDTATAPATSAEPTGVVARVGDQTITFRDLNTMINSAAIVGLSMPELGSPERDTVRLTLLDRLISANLLYLDALRQGLDQDPEYLHDLTVFRDGVLANLYRKQVLVGDLEVTDQEIEDFYRNNIVEGTELTDDLRTGIAATIRNNRVRERTAQMRETLRKGHQTAINVTDLDPEEDPVRNDPEVVAELDGVPITWGEARPVLQRAHALKSVQTRIEELEKLIDTRIMTQQAKEAGLENDPVYKARVDQFGKTRLINIHRGRLIDSWDPTDEEIRAYYDSHQDQIVVPEVRKVQILVVETEQEAADLKKRIEANEITFHKAVADYSIMPDAKKTLGQIGWVGEGTGFPELEEVTFMLEPAEIGGPVKTDTGWNLVRILDQRDSQHRNIADPQTRKKARRLLLEDKLDQYVVNLRKDSFPVDIDDDMFSKLAQQEVDWYQEMLQTKQKSPEEVIEEIRKLQK